MKTLLAMLLVSLSGLCSESETTRQSEPNKVNSIQPVADARSTSEWCTCALSVEETIFLQQYDIQ